MLRNRKVIVGKYYVNSTGRVAREVLGANDQTIIFNTYHLDTRNSCGSASEWSKQEFLHWADHEATIVEMAGLRYQKMEALLREPEFSIGKALEPVQN